MKNCDNIPAGGGLRLETFAIFIGRVAINYATPTAQQLVNSAHHVIRRNNTMASEPQDRRHAAFKKLITSIAEDLGREDVETICFMYSMPKESYSCSALKILARLENDGEFSPGDIQPLQKLLEDIKRQDICSKHIEKYQQDLYHGV